MTMRDSRTRVIEHRYNASEAVCLSELTKLFISLALTARAEPFKAQTLNYAEQIASNVNIIVLIFGYFFQLSISLIRSRILASSS